MTKISKAKCVLKNMQTGTPENTKNTGYQRTCWQVRNVISTDQEKNRLKTAYKQKDQNGNDYQSQTKRKKNSYRYLTFLPPKEKFLKNKTILPISNKHQWVTGDEVKLVEQNLVKAVNEAMKFLLSCTNTKDPPNHCRNRFFMRS